MKKVLLSLAVLATAMSAAAQNRGEYAVTKDMKEAGKEIEEFDNTVKYPTRILVGSVLSPLGNTVQYFAEGVDIIGKEGIEKAVLAVSDSIQCSGKALGKQPGEMAACVFRLGGDLTVTIINTVGYSAANGVDWVGEVASDFAFEWRDASYTLAQRLRDAGVPNALNGALLIGFILDASGKVIRVSVGTVSYTIRNTTEGLAMTAKKLVEAPVKIVTGRPLEAVDAAGLAISYATCTAVDVLLFPVHLGVGLANLIDKGQRKVISCVGSLKAGEGKYRPEEPRSDRGNDNIRQENP